MIPESVFSWQHFSNTSLILREVLHIRAAMHISSCFTVLFYVFFYCVWVIMAWVIHFDQSNKEYCRAAHLCLTLMHWRHISMKIRIKYLGLFKFTMKLFWCALICMKWNNIIFSNIQTWFIKDEKSMGHTPKLKGKDL